MKSSSFEERISIYCPNPPRCRPAPPLSGLSSRRNQDGATASVGSTCDPQTPDGNAVAEARQTGPRTVPPENTSSNANSSSPRDTASGTWRRQVVHAGCAFGRNLVGQNLRKTTIDQIGRHLP